MREIIRENSCRLANNGGEQHGRTFSASTADGINYLTDGLIEDRSSHVTHGLMYASVGAAALSFKNLNWIIILVILIVIIVLCWRLGQKDEAVRFIEGRERCTPVPIAIV